ncbi:MAG: GWxTD domain-containing protein [Bacteroidota bacterium]
MKGLTINLILFVLLFASCTTYKNLYQGDFNDFYSDDIFPLNIDYKPHHIGNKNYQLHFQLSSENLIYQRNLDTDDYEAELKINVVRYSGYGLQTKMDSVNSTIKDRKIGDLKRIISGKMNLPFKLEHQNILHIKATDLARDFTEEFIVPIDTTLSNSSNYLVKRNSDGLPLLHTYVKNGLYYDISSVYLKSNELSALYYKADFDLPSPPFSLKRPRKFDFEPEQNQMIEKREDATYLLRLQEENIVRIKDEVNGGDHSLIYFDSNYPKITDYGQMLESIRYITSKEEYERILGTEDKKLALDEFWLDKAGSEERAKKMIRTYYQRAENANKYFSCHTQGWKTDRGLIFIIFGEPKTVTKTLDSEIWNYGEVGKFRSLNFRFVRVRNPFSDNDFRMIRKEEYKPVWYHFIGAWREGRIIN